MSRKIFGPLTTDANKPASDQPASAPPPVPRPDPLHMRPLMGATDLLSDKDAQPVGAIGKSLSMLSERGKHAEDIEKKLAAGQSIVELDTNLIEPSFVSDRMPMSDEALSDLVDAIRENTQLSPVLVRPHPDQQGRYQTAFGHRRIRAAAILGIPVRAIVRELTDEQMVVAQGQENHARKDLSYIEKARFAQRLETRFKRETIMQALSVYKSDLSYMLSVAQHIPDDITEAIGPAPKTGRRGWIDLAELLKNPKRLETARGATTSPDFDHQDSDDRFKFILSAVKIAPIGPIAKSWTNSKGKQLAKVVTNAQRVTLTIDRKKAPEFAEFVLTRLQSLYIEFAKGGAERADPDT